MIDKKQKKGLKTRLKLFLLPIVCLFFALALYFSLGKDPHALGLAQKNRPVPIFNAENLLDPKTPITNEDFQGKITLLNVWASWCSACRHEHQFLQTLVNLQDINIYGLNYRDSRDKAMNALTENNPYKKVIFDPLGKLALEIGVYGTPETYLIDDNGIVRFRYAGELNEERWQSIFIPQIALITKKGKL